jgi:hypothetical protein
VTKDVEAAMPMKRWTALLALLAASPAPALTLRGSDAVEALAREAAAVVHARVLSVRSEWEGGRIRSVAALLPLDLWKGMPQELRVRAPGGSVGAISQRVPGAPEFTPGEEVVVFLRPRGGAFEVVRWALGKFTVRGQRARRSREGVQCAAGCEQARDELPLGELRGHVRRALEQQ